MDVRVLTVGPVQENCYLVRRDGEAKVAVLVDPGEEAERLLAAIDEAGVEIEAILLTHTHFDHIGAVAPVARVTGAPVYCPALEVEVLANIMDHVPWDGFGPFESWEADETVEGGERLELAGFEIDVVATPGHSPGHVTYAFALDDAYPDVPTVLASGDVLFQGSVGRTDLPGADPAVLLASIAEFLDRFEDEAVVLPGHMGTTTLGRERASNPFLQDLPGEPVSERLQAPRGTVDVLPDQAGVRLQVESCARRILEAAGYRRIETPAFELTEVFRRAVGASTDIVRKEMYTFEDGGGRSLTLRPEVTAPITRAYLEHGMHKLPQPVKLWYLSSCFRYERAQAGRQRQFWQIGAEALGSDDPAVDAEAIQLLHAILAELGVRGVRLRVASLGTPASREHYRGLLQAHLRAHEEELSAEVRERIDLNPLRAFDTDHPGTRAVMESAPLLMDHLDEADREHFAAVLSMLDVAEIPYDVDPTLVRGLDYYTRTVFEFTSDALGAQSGVGGGGRYDGLAEELGGPAVPGMGWAAGVERMLLAAEARPHPEPVCDLYIALAEGTAAQRLTAFGLAAEARGAGVPTQIELAGRSLKGQLKQAARLAARYVAIVGDAGIELKDMETGEQEAVDGASAVVAHVLRGRFV